MNGRSDQQPAYEAYTAFRHLRAVFGTGLLGGVFLFNEYIARKQLGASRGHILALLLIPALAQTLAVIWNPASTGGPIRRSPFRLLGIPAYALLVLPLLFLGFCGLTGDGIPFLGATAFIAVIVTCQSAASFLVPVQNSVLARNYATPTRGRRFGRAVAMEASAIILLSLPAGRFLDHYPGLWPPLYALAAAAGIFGMLQWAKLHKLRRSAAAAPIAAAPSATALRGTASRGTALRGTASRGVVEHASPWAVLRRDRQFLAFEACFMVYGIGFLMMQPVIPIFLVDELKITYSQVGLARGLIFWIVMVFTSPLLGKLADRVGVFRVAAIAFLLLSLFPLTLVFTGGLTGLFVAFGVYGLAMGGVSVAWNLGPIVVANGRDPLPYLNAHIGLVGVRALVAMVAGTWAQYTFGSRTVFVTAAVFEVAAALAMLAVARGSARASHPDPALADGESRAAHCGR